VVLIFACHDYVLKFVRFVFQHFVFPPKFVFTFQDSAVRFRDCIAKSLVFSTFQEGKVRFKAFQKFGKLWLFSISSTSLVFQQGLLKLANGLSKA
jgi:hypothetical protein